MFSSGSHTHNYGMCMKLQKMYTVRSLALTCSHVVDLLLPTAPSEARREGGRHDTCFTASRDRDGEERRESAVPPAPMAGAEVLDFWGEKRTWFRGMNEATPTHITRSERLLRLIARTRISFPILSP